MHLELEPVRLKGFASQFGGEDSFFGGLRPAGIGEELDVRAVEGCYEVIAVGMLELDTLECEGDEFGPRGFDSTSHEGGGGELPRTEEESRMEGLVCYGKHSGQVY